MRLLFILAFLCVSMPVSGQYAVSKIPEDLKEDVNAVIRDQETVITLENYNSMTLYYKEVITVFNRNGISAINAAVGYDSSSSIKKASAKVFDKNGKEIKKMKRRDFIDVSASGGVMYSDSKVLYVDYTPREYPFTFEFEYLKESTSTAFLPKWDPSPQYLVSTQNSSYKIINNKQVPLISRKYNLEKFNVTYAETPTEYSYQLSGMKAVKREALSPEYTEFTPVVKLALQRFQLMNQSGVAGTWKDFGLWMGEKLLKGRDKIPRATVAKVEQLVAAVEDPKEKTRIIYEYMQGKTRYVYIGIGIGGWQPSPAMEVDELSYGDCKGLTNYTKALLQSQGIESYYTIVDAGDDGLDIDEDFVALQGNHVILTVPFEDENVFLECTSQQTPYNYLGNFTDNRTALMITPEGGIITKTHVYDTKDNLQRLQATATIASDFKLSGTLAEISQGINYGNKYFLESATNDDVITYYKEMWGHLNNVTLENIKFENDKRAITFTEKLNFETDNYVSTAGDRVLLNPNIFNRFQYLPTVEENRTQPLKIRRGRTFQDEIEILLPDGYIIEAAFDPIVISSKFGNYKASVEPISGSKINYKRLFTLDSGTFSSEEYGDYVRFIQQIVKKDKSKIVLTKQ